MKTTLIGLLLFSSFAFASANSILLRTTTHTEFSPTPGMSVLTIDTNGRVEFQGPNATRNGEWQFLAQLSPQSLHKVQTQVDELNASSKLVDQDPKGPHCTDSPSVNMTAYQNGNEIHFYSMSSCHEFFMQDWRGHQLVQLIKGLQILAD